MGAKLWFMPVASLYWFVDKVCGGEDRIRGLTTAEVCERYVKPYVKKHKENPADGSSAARLIEMDCRIQRDPQAEKSAVFVSHSWQTLFMHTLEALYANLGPKAVVWMDVFSYNQFSPEVTDFGWWTKLLFETVKSCDKLALVCDLTDLNLDSNPCNRLWCLFETFISLQVDIAFEVYLTGPSEAAVKQNLHGWSNELLYYSVDINTAQCFLPRDKKHILSQVKLDSRDAFNASVSFLIKEQFYLVLAYLGAPVERWGPYLESLKIAEESTVADHGRYNPNHVPLFSVSDPLDLIEASEAGNYLKVKELLKKGTPVNGTDDKGQSALHAAATYKIASYLIHARADVNLKDEARGLTPLHTAKNYQVTRALLENDADVNAQDSQLWRPMHCVAGLPESETQKGPGIADALVAANADVNVYTEEGVTPLHRAAELGRKDVVEALVQARADVNACDSITVSPVPFLQCPPRREITASSGRMEGLTMVTVRWAQGATPLHRAKKSKVVIALIAANADVHAKTSDEHGETALHTAAQRGDPEIVVALLAGRAKVNAKDGSRWKRTALHRAAKHGHSVQTIDTLIAVKADVNLPEDTTGDTPLHLSCCQAGGYTEAGVVEMLVKYKANLHAVNKLGQTPLHKAAKECHSEEVIDTLCQARADVNVKDDLAGETPLHMAASQEMYTELEVAEALIAAGADVNARNYAGDTPLDKAIISHSQTNNTADVQALIKRHGGTIASRRTGCQCCVS